MTPQEAAGLLAIAAAFDNRKPDADAAAAWALALDGMRFEDCREVVVQHYRTSGDWLMPHIVITAVKRLRTKRIDDYGYIEPPAGIDPDDTGAYAAWLERMRRAIADGDITAPTPAPIEGRDISSDLAAVERELPRP